MMAPPQNPDAQFMHALMRRRMAQQGPAIGGMPSPVMDGALGGGAPPPPVPGMGGRIGLPTPVAPPMGQPPMGGGPPPDQSALGDGGFIKRPMPQPGSPIGQVPPQAGGAPVMGGPKPDTGQDPYVQALLAKMGIGGGQRQLY